MHNLVLNPIIPRPAIIDTKDLKGKLFIEGSLEKNYFRFRFQFDKPSETAPVSILVQAAGNEFVYNCTIMDYKKNEVKTVVSHPEFFIGSRFNIVNIEPLVKIFP